MYQAITTKYIGPSNVRGSRVKASYDGGSLTLDWDDALSSAGNHVAAAKALATKMQWDGFYVGGSAYEGYAFVKVDGATSSLRFDFQVVS